MPDVHLSEEDIDRLAHAIHGLDHKEHEEEVSSKFRHLPRRCVIIAVVVGIGVAAHYLVESPELRGLFHSAELALAALFDVLWKRYVDSMV